MSNEKVNNPPFKVYVVGGGMEYIRLMYDLCCDGAKDMYEADIVLFTGGEDVNPKYYGEVPLPRTQYNAARDEKERKIFDFCVMNKIPMIGICRGGQFLNVMCGGKLWQHVSGHTAPHIARVEVPPYNEGDRRRTIMVTSTHHQMMIPTEEACVLMTALKAYEKECAGLHRAGMDKDKPDTEAVWYEEQQCLCFQPHPEFMNATAELRDIFEEFIEDFVYPCAEIRRKGAVVKETKKKKEKA